jgi:hypothetical protein
MELNERINRLADLVYLLQSCSGKKPKNKAEAQSIRLQYSILCKTARKVALEIKSLTMASIWEVKYKVDDNPTVLEARITGVNKEQIKTVIQTYNLKAEKVQILEILEIPTYINKVKL